MVHISPSFDWKNSFDDLWHLRRPKILIHSKVNDQTCIKLCRTRAKFTFATFFNQLGSSLPILAKVVDFGEEVSPSEETFQLQDALYSASNGNGDVSIMSLVYGNSCMNIPCKFLGPFHAVTTILFECERSRCRCPPLSCCTAHFWRDGSAIAGPQQNWKKMTNSYTIWQCITQSMQKIWT